MHRRKDIENVLDSEKGGIYTLTKAENILKNVDLSTILRKSIIFHMFIHSFSTNLLEQGVGLVYIQDLLEHYSSKTTNIYTRVSKKPLII